MAEQIMDIHSHILPREYRQAAEAGGQQGSCPGWDLKAQYARMRQAGITACLLSVPPLAPMPGRGPEYIDLIRLLNSRSAALVRQDPSVFRFAAGLPLPLVEASCDEAVRTLDLLGASALVLPSCAGGMYPDDPALEPLMALLNERRAVVLLHPGCQPGRRTDASAADALQLLDAEAELTRAVLRLIASGLPDRWPGIRFVVPHAGSFLPSLIGRLKTGPAGFGGERQPDLRESLRPFYFDLSGNCPPAALSGLAAVIRPDRLLFGTDSPFSSPDDVLRLRKELEEDPLTSPFLPEILFENCRSLFRF